MFTAPTIDHDSTAKMFRLLDFAHGGTLNSLTSLVDLVHTPTGQSSVQRQISMKHVL